MLDATSDSDPEHERVQNDQRLRRQQYALQNSRKMRPRTWHELIDHRVANVHSQLLHYPDMFMLLGYNMRIAHGRLLTIALRKL